MALEAIKSEVGKLTTDPLTEFQVELGNAMLREVHKLLLQKGEIATTWPGIPEGVAYEQKIKEHLTPKNINKVYQAALGKLQKPLHEVAELVCEGSLQNFWALMTLGKDEIKIIKVPLEQLKKEYQDPGLASDRSSQLESEIPTREEACKAEILQKSREATNKYLAENPQIATSSDTPSTSPARTSATKVGCFSWFFPPTGR